MELVYEFRYEHNGTKYSIQVVKTPRTHEVEVHPQGSPDILYSYRLGIKSWDNPNLERMRAYWFFAAARAFDIVNALA